MEYLRENEIHCGDARDMLKRIRPDSVALSFWSPPYFVGKSYEKSLTFERLRRRSVFPPPAFTPLFHDDSPDYPFWRILNLFMAQGAVAASAE